MRMIGGASAEGMALGTLWYCRFGGRFSMNAVMFASIFAASSATRHVSLGLTGAAVAKRMFAIRVISSVNLRRWGVGNASSQDEDAKRIAGSSHLDIQFSCCRMQISLNKLAPISVFS
jgi:hypothetical protein